MKPEELFGPPPLWQILLLLAVIFTSGVSLSYAFDSNQADKSHCAPGVQGRCIEMAPPNPCRERK